MAIEVVGGGHVLPEERPDAIAAGVLAMRDGYGGEQYASSDPLSDWSRPVTVVIGHPRWLTVVSRSPLRFARTSSAVAWRASHARAGRGAQMTTSCRAA